MNYSTVLQTFGCKGFLKGKVYLTSLLCIALLFLTSKTLLSQTDIEPCLSVPIPEASKLPAPLPTGCEGYDWQTVY